MPAAAPVSHIIDRMSRMMLYVGGRPSVFIDHRTHPRSRLSTTTMPVPFCACLADVLLFTS